MDPAEQRKLGVDLFNATWRLIEKPDRTVAEDDEMVHCAHASAYHWLQVGTTANRARSEWQCSRVYAILDRPEPALHHAHRCLELVESSPAEMEEFDLPAAYEALARAYSVAGNPAEARRYLELGREATAKITDEGDRKHMEDDLATVHP
jgi:hypothetical protein